ncbi:MAG: DUF2299 domain-containing protein [Candidatus Heimdallarchaeota archaeon]|nr:DUF2299 domain-containing protein [Candidatus Heimdallarchaeota archaeon]
MTSEALKNKIITWINLRPNSSLEEIPNEEHDVYLYRQGTSLPLTLIFPGDQDDHLVLQFGVKIADEHRNQINALPEGEKQNILAKMKYEMSSQGLASHSSTKDENGIFNEVRFTAEIYSGGLTQNYFMDKLIHIRSIALRFVAFTGTLF